MNAMTIPLGTGVTVEIVVDTPNAWARAAVVDDHYKETIFAPDMMGFADAILGTYFMVPTGAGFGPSSVRLYKPHEGWTDGGWSSSFTNRIKATWADAEDLGLLLVH